MTDAALAHLELDDLLAALLDRTRDLLGVDTVAVLLLDEETDELVARAAVGIEEEVEQGIRIPVGRGFAGRIAAQRRPVVLPDVDHADILNPILRQKRIRSMLGVPLLVEGRSVGVLHVGSLVPREFGRDEVDLLQLVADRASIAIEHARLFAAERAARQRLEHVQAVTDAALAHLELEELLAVLLQRIKTILRSDTVAFLLLDEETNELVARAALGIEEEVEQGVRIPVGAGFAGRVAASRQPVIIPNLDEFAVFNPILRQKHIRSMLGVPLITRGAVLGVLHVGTLTPRQFTQADVDLLQLVADRVSISIEHARAYDAERRARERLEHVQSVTDAALAHLELEDLLGVLLHRIRAILRTDTVAFLLLDEETDELVARAAVGIEEEVEQGVRIPVGRGFAGRIAAEKRPVLLPDVDHAHVLNPILREKGIKTLLGVPLVVGDRAVGVLHVGTLSPREFGQDEIDVLQLVADRAALAIERARLHDEIVQLDQLKLNFVAVASHELRTPATSLYGVVATLYERGDDLPPELRRELLRIGYEQGERLRRLLEQLLDLSRLDARAIRVEPKPLVLRSIVSEIVEAVAPEGSAVRVDVAEDLAVFADRLVLERVISNLLSNALRYGRPPVVVTAEQRDRHLRIAVEDSGEGVPDELQGRIFERFERAGEGAGSGLGLAIARAYARAHGGDLVYEPQGRGARFELVVPREHSPGR